MMNIGIKLADISDIMHYISYYKINHKLSYLPIGI
jgi:hypothetical protein